MRSRARGLNLQSWRHFRHRANCVDLPFHAGALRASAGADLAPARTPLEDTYGESDLDATLPGFHDHCGGPAGVRRAHGRERDAPAWRIFGPQGDGLAVGACGVCAAAIAVRGSA